MSAVPKFRVLLSFVVACGVLGAACSNDTSTTTTSAAGNGTTVLTVDTSATGTGADAGTGDTSTTTPAYGDGKWQSITAPSNCMCSDGSTFTYFVRKADPNKVLFFLQGGGACFSKDTCAPGSKSYTHTDQYTNGMTESQGIFDFTNPANPFKDYSIVFVPYCTGDVHIGNATTDYGGGVVVHHNGYVNGTTALAKMAELFPSAVQIVVAGESAGSIPSPLYAGLAHDLLPEAKLTVLADGSGAYPDVPVLNKTIGTEWGTMKAVPAWPENDGMTVERWSLPGLFVQAGKHDPTITFARHDYAFDKTQTAFAALAGVAASDLVQLIDKNETQIEASGIQLYSYISPGTSHTVLGKDAFYTETLNGTLFVDWVRDLITAQPIADVHCTGACTTP